MFFPKKCFMANIGSGFCSNNAHQQDIQIEDKQN